MRKPLFCMQYNDCRVGTCTLQAVCSSFIVNCSVSCNWNNNNINFNPYSTCTDTGMIACTERACVNICSLRAETGDCRGYFPSYFYNHTSMRCERFIYGGCGGNQNRFNTSQECNQRCNPSKLKSDIISCTCIQLLFCYMCMLAKLLYRGLQVGWGTRVWVGNQNLYL